MNEQQKEAIVAYVLQQIELADLQRKVLSDENSSMLEKRIADDTLHSIKYDLLSELRQIIQQNK